MPKIYLRKIRINNGGYDDSGQYWGIGAPLYMANSDEWDYPKYFRAYSRDDAKATVRAMPGMQGVSFYN
jgi:hypothetical protein